MGEQEKTHENRIKVLQDGATKDLEIIRKGNARKIQEIVAERKRYEIERREMEEKARGDARVEEVKAMSYADVALKKSKGDDQVQRATSCVTGKCCGSFEECTGPLPKDEN